MKKLMNLFFQGLIFLVPIFLSLYVFYALFRTVDGWFGFGVPGVGVVITLVVVLAVGFLADHLFTKRILRLLSHLVDRLPFVKILHSALSDLLSAVVGEKRRFDKPVLVKLYGTIKVLGFVTQDTMTHFGVEGHVAVYLPQSYNFAGQLLIVPSAEVTPLHADSAEIMTFIVSGGISKKETPAGAGGDSAHGETDRS